MISARTLAPALALLLSGCLDTRLETYCQREPYSALCTLEATGLAPVEGPIAGGTTVTIQGHGFDQDSEVRVDGVPATVVSRTNGSLVVRTPPHAEGNAVFSVVNSLGSVEVPKPFRYAAPPTVSEVSPNEADRTGGALIRIAGVNLTGATVTIGGRALLDVSATATEITGTLPSLMRGLQDVVVTTAGGSVTLPASFLARAWYRSSEGWQEATALGFSAGVGSGAPLYLAATGGDVYRTTASASSWERAWTQPGIRDHAVAVSPAGSGRVLSASRAGIFLTEDGFASVRGVHSGPVAPTIAFTADGERAIAGDEAGLLLSRDKGSTWTPIALGERIDHVAAARDNTTVLAAASFTRLWVSRDSGENWEERTLPQPGVLSLELTATVIALGDQTGARVTPTSENGAFTTCDTTPAAALAWDPATPGRLWLASSGAPLRYTSATGAGCGAFTNGPSQPFTSGSALTFLGTQLYAAGAYAPYLLESLTGSWKVRDAGLQAPLVSAVAVVGSGTDRVLYANSNRGQVYRRASDGLWTKYGPSLGELTYRSPLYATPEAGAHRLFSPLGTPRTLAPGGASWVASTGVTDTVLTSLQDANAPAPQPILVATLSSVFRSVDGGVSFSNIATGLPSNLVVSALEADGTSYYAATSDNRVFRTAVDTIQWIELPALTGQGFLRGLARAKNALLITAGNAGVFRLADGAGAWTPSGSTNYASENLRANPFNRDIVYLMRGGAFQQSTDGGLTWASVNDGSYPEESISDCVVDPTEDRVYLLGMTPLFESVFGGP